MILYFTATGNSKYLAETMATALCDTAVDVAKQIKAGQTPHLESEKPYLFVSPVYAWRFPRIFAEWIEKCSFAGNQKAYFLVNCGSEIGAAEKYIKKIAAKQGFDYMGTAEIVMPENYLVMFAPPKAEEDAGIIAKATEQVGKLCKQIAQEVRLEKVKTNFVGHLCSDIVNPCFYTFYVGAKKFYATDACIACGQCVENCMLNNITLQDGKPVWGKDCTHCMACICKCPTAAIEYGKKTKGRRRYTFPKE